MLAMRADAGTKHGPSSQPQADAAAASGPRAADAGDDDWALSEDDGADDEATLDAEELAALADGCNVKVSSERCPYISIIRHLTMLMLSLQLPWSTSEALRVLAFGQPST